MTDDKRREPLSRDKLLGLLDLGVRWRLGPRAVPAEELISEAGYVLAEADLWADFNRRDYEIRADERRKAIAIALEHDNETRKPEGRGHYSVATAKAIAAAIEAQEAEE